jgi:hypothetical protein
MHARLPSLALAAALAAALVSLAAPAEAAPPWVERHLTMPSGTWAFDFGLGVGHVPAQEDNTAVGVNLEMAVAIDRVELGLRTGLRPGDGFARGIEADNYGRLFDRQYFDGGADVLANPEFRVRVAILRGPVADLAVEGRIIIPVDPGVAGLEPGLPLAFHLGNHVRLDTGVWLPIVTGQDSYVGISVPLDVWFQITHRLWLGPMTGIYAGHLGGPPPRSNAVFSFGFGLGYQITHFLDFKTMLLMPDISDDSRFFGVGAGVQIRIE